MERGREVLTWDEVGEVSRGQMMQDCLSVSENYSEGSH